MATGTATGPHTPDVRQRISASEPNLDPTATGRGIGRVSGGYRVAPVPPPQHRSSTQCGCRPNIAKRAVTTVSTTFSGGSPDLSAEFRRWWDTSPQHRMRPGQGSAPRPGKEPGWLATTWRNVVKFLPESGPVSAAVIGLGQVGVCVAASHADNGLNVIGIDKNLQLVDTLGRAECPYRERGLAQIIARWVGTPRLRVTDSYADVGSTDVIVIAVGTPALDDGRLAEDQLRSASEQVGRHARPGQLVIVKSTVPPGTSRAVVRPLLESGGLRCGVDLGLACCPERLSEGDALHELATLPIVVGGWCDESAAAAAAFWNRSLGSDVSTLASLEAAEIVKLATNWWIDLNVAMANELAVWCDSFGVDALAVIAAANTAPKGTGNVNILLPSVGVGGSCLTKDPWMAWRSAQDREVDIKTIPAARTANDAMPDYTFKLISDELIKAGKRSMARVSPFSDSRSRTTPVTCDVRQPDLSSRRSATAAQRCPFSILWSTAPKRLGSSPRSWPAPFRMR